MDYQLMGKKIRTLRQQQKLTQAQLAEAADVSTSFIGHIERGTRKASLETLERICRAMQASMDAVAMPPHGEVVIAGYSDEQLCQARMLLKAALEMCK